MLRHFDQAKKALKPQTKNSQCLKNYIQEAINVYKKSKRDKVSGHRGNDIQEIERIIDAKKSDEDILIEIQKFFHHSDSKYKTGLLGQSYFFDCIQAAIFLWRCEKIEAEKRQAEISRGKIYEEGTQQSKWNAENVRRAYFLLNSVDKKMTLSETKLTDLNALKKDEKVSKDKLNKIFGSATSKIIEKLSQDLPSKADEREITYTYTIKDCILFAIQEALDDEDIDGGFREKLLEFRKKIDGLHETLVDDKIFEEVVSTFIHTNLRDKDNEKFFRHYRQIREHFRKMLSRIPQQVSDEALKTVFDKCIDFLDKTKKEDLKAELKIVYDEVKKNQGKIAIGKKEEIFINRAALERLREKVNGLENTDVSLKSLLNLFSPEKHIVQREIKIKKISDGSSTSDPSAAVSELLPKESKKRKVIFALHGLDDSSDTWKALVLQGYEIISYDHAGHGYDQLRSGQYGLDLQQMRFDFYKQLQTLTNDTTIEEIHLIGHSLGGALLCNSMETINNNPKIKSVTCISPAVMKSPIKNLLGTLPTALSKDPGNQEPNVFAMRNDRNLAGLRRIGGIGVRGLFGQLGVFIQFVSKSFYHLRQLTKNANYKQVSPGDKKSWLIFSTDKDKLVSSSNFNRLFSGQNAQSNVNHIRLKNVGHHSHQLGSSAQELVIKHISDNIKLHSNGPQVKP